MPFKPLVAGAKPLASDMNQFTQALSGQADIGTIQLALPQGTPAAPVVSVNAVSGNLNGAYYYKVVLITGWMQSDGSYYVSGFAPSNDSIQISVTNQQVNVTVQVGVAPCIGRAVYRTVAGGATGSEQFCGVIWDNVTTAYTDNLADSALGTNLPGTPTSAMITSMTQGSTAVSVSSTLGMAAGETIVGNGIPYGTTIQSITDSTDLVLSQAATATLSSAGTVYAFPPNGAVFGTPVPAAVPISNTTGTNLAANITGNVAATLYAYRNIGGYL